MTAKTASLLHLMHEARRDLAQLVVLADSPTFLASVSCASMAQCSTRLNWLKRHIREAPASGDEEASYAELLGIMDRAEKRHVSNEGLQGVPVDAFPRDEVRGLKLALGVFRKSSDRSDAD